MPAIATASQVQPGELLSVDLQGARICVTNVGGKYYAFAEACSHAGCSLTKGKLEGMVITCGCHGSQFDIASGNVITGPATGRIRTYRVQVDSEELRI